MKRGRRPAGKRRPQYPLKSLVSVSSAEKCEKEYCKKQRASHTRFIRTRTVYFYASGVNGILFEGLSERSCQKELSAISNQLSAGRCQSVFGNCFEPRSGDQKVARRETSGTRRRWIPASETRREVSGAPSERGTVIARHQTLHVWLPSYRRLRGGELNAACAAGREFPDTLSMVSGSRGVARRP